MPEKIIPLNTDDTNANRLKILTAKLDKEETDSEQMFKAFMAVSSIPNIITNQTEILFVNKSFESFFGTTYKKLVGKDIISFVSEECQNVAKEAFSSESETIVVIDIIKKNGEKATVELHSHSIPYKDKICRLNAIKEIV